MPVLSGEVLCRFTGEPVAGAIVNVNGYRAITGTDGSFSITVPEGTYTITVSASGFEQATTSASVYEDTFITILLTPIVRTL